MACANAAISVEFEALTHFFSVWLFLSFPVAMAAGGMPKFFRGGNRISDFSFGLGMASIFQKGLYS